MVLWEVKQRTKALRGAVGLQDPCGVPESFHIMNAQVLEMKGVCEEQAIPFPVGANGKSKAFPVTNEVYRPNHLTRSHGA